MFIKDSIWVMEMPNYKPMTIYVCVAECCGNQGLCARFQDEIDRRSFPIDIEESACLETCGLCSRVDVLINGEHRERS